MDAFFRGPVSARNAIRVIVVATAVMTVVGAVLVRVLDRADFPTMGDALWWSLQTVTTVGYGDITPKTPVGRAVGAVVVLYSVGFLAILTASITTSFMERARRQRGDEHGRDLAAVLERLDDIAARLDRLEGGPGRGAGCGPCGRHAAFVVPGLTARAEGPAATSGPVPRRQPPASDFVPHHSGEGNRPSRAAHPAPGQRAPATTRLPVCSAGAGYDGRGAGGGDRRAQRVRAPGVALSDVRVAPLSNGSRRRSSAPSTPSAPTTSTAAATARSGPIRVEDDASSSATSVVSRTSPAASSLNPKSMSPHHAVRADEEVGQAEVAVGDAVAPQHHDLAPRPGPAPRR